MFVLIPRRQPNKQSSPFQSRTPSPTSSVVPSEPDHRVLPAILVGGSTSLLALLASLEIVVDRKTITVIRNTLLFFTTVTSTTTWTLTIRFAMSFIPAASLGLVAALIYYHWPSIKRRIINVYQLLTTYSNDELEDLLRGRFSRRGPLRLGDLEDLLRGRSSHRAPALLDF